MSEPAAEMPISEARDKLADVVNRAAYTGEPTYITRRGRRLAAIVSPTQLAVDQARASQLAVVAACRQMWESVADRDDATRDAVRAVIDHAVELAEDVGDVAAVKAMLAEREAGASATSWDEVKAEMGL